MNTNRWLDGLSIVYGRYIGLGINYWPDPNNRNANERSMSQSSDIASKGNFFRTPIISWEGEINQWKIKRMWDLILSVYECTATGRKHIYFFPSGTWTGGWVDDGTFGKHLPPQPGKSHPSDRARGDKEDRARLQIIADNWHKNEKFAFVFYVFVAYTAHTWVYTGGSSVSAQIGAVKAGKVNQGRAVNSVQASTSWAVQASTHAAQIIWAPVKRLSVQWVGGIALIFLERLFNI